MANSAVCAVRYTSLEGAAPSALFARRKTANSEERIYHSQFQLSEIEFTLPSRLHRPRGFPATFTPATGALSDPGRI